MNNKQMISRQLFIAVPQPTPTTRMRQSSQNSRSLTVSNLREEMGHIFEGGRCRNQFPQPLVYEELLCVYPFERSDRLTSIYCKDGAF